ncbi:AcrR family transcriptional regulator [Microbacterium sp. SORGH_AS428]|uniref:TetR/AcrR family transcriptional regulator n=1 Tax=Microbacterium sp. SORGH_AS_0428 TaxID=3041788 RepID=UPI002862EDBD|nr:TetR/AcrR family transcriptional regulator [Microbacterium sp. SORGH_AS_0428]MDR6200000.1 AcrR family transcriptional regulator [Microbacterium sp. SORGH_AS_0428]
MGKQQRSEETREALIQSGSRLFATTPFDKARIADVIGPLGLTQGAFYFHFENKHDLALEIIRREHAKMVELSEAVLDAADSGLAGLHEVSSRLAELVRSDIVVQAGLRLTSHTPQEFPEFLGASFAIWNATIEKFLLRGQGEGDVRRDLDVHAAARFVVATFVGVQEISAVATGWADLDERIREVSSLAIRGIATEDGYAAFAASIPGA